MLFRSKQKTAYEILSRDWSSDVCFPILPRVAHTLSCMCAPSLLPRRVGRRCAVLWHACSSPWLPVSERQPRGAHIPTKSVGTYAPPTGPFDRLSRSAGSTAWECPSIRAQEFDRSVTGPRRRGPQERPVALLSGVVRRARYALSFSSLSRWCGVSCGDTCIMLREPRQ